MLPIRLFNIVPTQVLPPETRCRLFVDEQATSILLSGCNLVGQFSTGQHYLLITDHDNPYEEILCVHLLDLELNLLDTLEISRPMTTGCYELLFAAPGEVAFRFFAQDEIWRLTLVRPARFPPLRMPRFPVKRRAKVKGSVCLQLTHSVIKDKRQINDQAATL